MLENNNKCEGESEWKISSQPDAEDPIWFKWLRCTACGASLRVSSQVLSCDHGHEFRRQGKRVFFDIQAREHQDLNSDLGHSMQRAYRKPNRWMRSLRQLISSEFSPGRAWRKAKQRALAQQPCLILGSGVTRYPGGIHLDLADFPGVDVVGDGHHLPFQDNCLPAVVCEVVLEHVAHPQQLIAEVFRVLAPGGSIFFIVPFLFPFHGHPNDYRRWSLSGLAVDFDAFIAHEIGIHAGPCSAMVNLWTDGIALLFGQSQGLGYTAVKGLSTALLFPFKYLDLIVNRMPGAHRMAATLYLCAIKPPARIGLEPVEK